MTPISNGRILTAGSDAWDVWLADEDTRAFRVLTPATRYTARRERRWHESFWYGYRRRRGKLQKVYIGKAADLTVARLLEVGAALAASSPGNSG